MSSSTGDTYTESVGSCRPLTPPASPSPHPAPAAALRGAPVRRQLDFAESDAGAVAGAGGDLDDYDLIAVDDIVRGYNEAKRRAPPCVCRRGDCAVQRDNKRGRWMYVCPSQPKCKHVEEVNQNPQSPPAVGSDPKPSNPCVFSVPRTPVDDARTRINNINPQGADATTPVNVSPQAAVAITPLNYTSKGVGATLPVHVSPQGVGAMTPVHVSPQGAAGATTPVNVSPQAAVATTPFNNTLKGVRALTPQGARAMTPVHVSPQGAGTTAAVKVSPQWSRSNDGQPICQCTAGKCKIMRVGNEDCYVCHIPKGQGACSFKVPVTAFKGPPQIGEHNIMEAHGNNAVGVGENNANGSANPAQPNDDEWPFEVIDNEIVPTGQAMPHAVVQQKSPGTPRQPIAMAKTPATSPMTPFGSHSPMTRHPNACYGCGDEGHWISTCPKRNSGSPMTRRPNKACHGCGEEGHWIKSCPKRNSCFHCGMVGHRQANCPQPRGA